MTTRNWGDVNGSASFIPRSGQLEQHEMIFRLSQKLNAKIKSGPLQAMPLADNPFADWSASLFVAERTQYILLSHTTTLYSVVMFAKGITSDWNFIERALSNIRELMQDDGYESEYLSLIAPDTARVRFAAALDRSVTSSLNELIQQAKYCLSDGGSSPSDASVELNDLLLSAIAANKADKYGKPREAFQALVESKLLS
jgi:hypothetical protein